MYRLPTRVSAPAGYIQRAGFLGVVGPHLLAVEDGVYALTRFELNGQQRLFIVTELAENDGHPLSFAAERIATEILRRYGADIPPSSALFVEHYDPGVSFRGPATAECERFLEWSVTWHDRQAVFIHPKPVSKRGTH